MILLDLFDRYGAEQRNRVIQASLVGGFLGAVIVAVANIASAAEGQDGDAGSLIIGLLFLVALAVMYVANRWATRVVVEIFENLQCGLRNELASGLRTAPLRTIEDLGALRGQIMSDLVFISSCMSPLVSGIQNAAFLASVTVVIAFVSFKGLLIWLVTCGAIAWWLVRGMKQLQRRQGQISAHGGKFHTELEELLDGFTQVKFNGRAGDMLVEDIKHATATLYSAQDDVGKATNSTSIGADFLFFFLGFGLTVFASADTIGLGPEVGYEVSMLLALSIGPLFGLLRALPVMSKAEATAAGVVAVLDRLAEQSGEALGIDGAEFNEIELKDLEFSYSAHRDGGKPGYVVGPVNLTVRRGELTFVTGDNGTGKTTLMKMLLGFYPTRGTIRWDGRIVEDYNLAKYRGLFTAIFNGQHLFDHLYGLDVPVEKIEAVLDRFGIADAVRFDGTRFGSLELSSGQRMRLAMVVALLEDRPICVFDEWTANQDPKTTRFYYDTLLPELLAAGKTIIAVSHDERFVERADHQIELNNTGKVSLDRRPSEE